MVHPVFLLAALALVLLAPSASAQIALGPNVTFEISGGIQPRVGLGVQEVSVEDRTDARLGVGLRRARVQFNLTYRDRVGLEYDLDAAPGDVRSVDLFAFYDVNDRVQIRAGRLPVAQPRAYIPTSNTRIDAIDRAIIAERWSSGTIGSSGRDFGAEVGVEAGNTEFQLSVHNGAGGFSRDVDNFRESGSAGSLTRGTDRVELAVGASAHHELGGGLSFGGFAGINPAGGEETVLETATGEVQRGYASASAHFYWGERPGSQPIRLKFDALVIQYEEVGGFRQQAAGVLGFGAVRVLGHGEAFVRAEQFWEDVDAQGATYGTVGLSYSPSAALGDDYRDVRITGAYTIRTDEADDLGHLFVIQGQFVF
jgi:hypothetical protein